MHESELARFVEVVPDATLIVNSDGRIIFGNVAAHQMFGFGPADLAGRAVDELVAERVLVQHRALRADYLRHPLRGLMPTRRANAARRQDGSEFPVEVSLAPVPLLDRTVIVVIVRDVTKQRRLQARLATADRMASMGLLMAGVAHDINNPLAAVLANIELAQSVVSNSAADQGEVPVLLQEAHGAATRVRQLVADLRVHSRHESGDDTAVDVARVIRSSIRLARNEIRHRALLVEGYSAVPAVRGNELRLGQVFLNLLVNAAQAIPEGHAADHRISVSVRGATGNRVEVSITDSGVGIPAEHLGRVFEPFFTTKPIGFGTGLGLDICRRIITSMGGEIGIASTVGVGTTVRVTLPTTTGEVRPNEPPSPPAPRSSAMRRGRILAVDDEPAITEAIRRTLLPWHDVVTCNRATEALAMFESGGRFDLVICDLMMPDLTGWELLKRVAAVDSNQAERILFLTGGAFTPDTEEFLKAHPERCLEKPFNIARLRERVDQFVAWPS